MKSDTSAGKTHQQLPQDVAKYVREQIISGQVRKGEFLRIDALAKVLGVSSTPVREGLLVLQSESFVRLVPRRGFVVLDFSRQDVRDIFWGQSVLAAELASRAARLASQQQLDEIAGFDRSYVAAVQSGQMEDAHHFGHCFHRAINLAACSRRLAMMLASMVRQLPNRFYGMMDSHVQETLIAHQGILAALVARDADLAGALMRAHILAGAEHLIAHLEEQSIWSIEDAASGPMAAMVAD